MELRQGIDIVSIQRLQNSIRRYGPSFLVKVYTSAERSYCESKRRKYEHYAARFAAKEAVLKVLGLDAKRSCRLQEIEIFHHPTGKPAVRLAPQARRRLRLPPKFQIEISMSHERDYAIATALLYSP